ncbi:MAG: asparagine synthase (glutamine-hydrolyzing), partial [Planctomycetaceae bacterium]
MCGLTGAVWSGEHEPLSDAVLRRMTDVLAHRGPDDAGLYFSPQSRGVSARSDGGPCAALGFRRLSIIDLEGGHQPLSNEDGTIWIIFNGEIYNYRELRPPLEAAGHRFRTHSDTETIIHLYEEHGSDCVEHLRGMFVFAIWDERRRRLFLARDRLGQKPLFYRHDPGRLIFASELKSLLQMPGAPREVDPQAVDLYFTYQYVPHPHCILRGYRKLPPAHWMLYENDRLEVRRYWSPPFDDAEGVQRVQRQPIEETRRQLRETLTEAVRLRMRSDVPLGAFLSGGIDSTIIVGLMQSLSERPVHTFSIGFPIESFDERSYAREAATHLGTDHHEYVVEPSSLEILPRLIWQYDEPFSDSSAIPMMYLSEVTRREVTVALSGDGGDEVFGGYNRYAYGQRMLERMRQVPRPARRAIAAAIGSIGPDSWDRAHRAVRPLLPNGLRQRMPGEKLHKIAHLMGSDSVPHMYRSLVSAWQQPEALVIGSRRHEGELE